MSEDGDRRSMRIAVVHGPAPPELDGVSDYVVHLIGALTDTGMDVVGVPVRPSAPERWTAATFAAAKAIRRLRPDLVHVQFAPSAYRFSPLAGLLPTLLPRRVPVVTTLHEYGWWAFPRWVPDVVWRPMEALRVWDRETGRLVPASRTVIVTNSAHANHVNRRTGRRAVQIPLAPNVVDQEGGPDGRHQVRQQLRPQLRQHRRQQLGLPAEGPLLVFFGFVHPVKGLRYVIEALPALRAEWPSLHFVAIGGFTSQALPEPQARAFRAELQRVADDAGVSQAVTFTGHVPSAQVSELLRVADAAVLPFTAGVTFKSGSLLATLAHGVPTAVTVPEELEDQLRDGYAVAVIPNRRDAVAVASTLRQLLADDGLRRRLSARGMAVAARHSWSEVAAAHRTLYREVLDGRDG